MLEYLDIYENVLSTFSGQYIQLALNFKTVPKKWDWPKKMPITKNPQFFSKYLKIQAIIPPHGLVSLTKFHNDRAKNVDF